MDEKRKCKKKCGGLVSVAMEDKEYSCRKECGGSGICDHGKACAECGWGAVLYHDKDKYKRMQANQGLLSLKRMSHYLESSKETELVEAVIEPEAVHLVQSPNIRISKQ
jgi:Na+-transporting NADH:ubiquinone oxidoreductase subunit NqrF